MERTEILDVDGTKYPCQIYIEHRHSVRVSIGKNTVRIYLPSDINRDILAIEIEKAKEWVRKKLRQRQLISRKKSKRSYTHGETLHIGKDSYTLFIEEEQRSTSRVRWVENSIFFYISANILNEQKQEHCSILLSKAIAVIKRPYMQERVKALNEKHFNFHYHSIFLKNNQTNWGSCSSKRNLNFSTRLFFAPEDVIDYVCVHELAHLQEANHSPAFWSLVEKAIPQYKEKRQWLKDHGQECVF